MGRIWMPGGGGGADLDAVTAEAGDVISGKVIVDANGNPLMGTMPTMAGGTKTPTTSQQTIACSGKKMTSDIVIPAFSLPSASVILAGKTVTIYGKSVTGTAQQYINTPSNVLSDGGGVTRLSGISASGDKYSFNVYGTNGSPGLGRFNNAFNLSNYKYIKVTANETAQSGTYGTAHLVIGVSTKADNTGVTWSSVYKLNSSNGVYVLDITSLSGMYYIYIKGYSNSSSSNGAHGTAAVLSNS